MKDFGKYLINTEYPEKTLGYKKLRWVLKRDFILLISPTFWANIGYEDIFINDLLEDLDLPDDFGDFSPSKKARLYISQLASTNQGWLNEVSKVWDKESIQNSWLIRLISVMADMAEDSYAHRIFEETGFPFGIFFRFFSTEQKNFAEEWIKKTLDNYHFFDEEKAFSDLNPRKNIAIDYPTIILLGSESEGSFNRIYFTRPTVLVALREDFEDLYEKGSLIINRHIQHQTLILGEKESDFQSFFEGINSFFTTRQEIITNDTKGLLPLPPTSLESVQLSHYFSLQQAQLDELSQFQEIYFLGENGDGKTLLLQALVLAMKWQFIEAHTRKEITGGLLDIMNQDPAPTFSGTDQDGQAFGTEGKSYVTSVYAYGVERGRSTEDFQNAEQYGFMSLFNNQQLLRSPIRWLKDIYSKELEAKNGASKEPLPLISLEVAKAMLKELLDDEENEIEITVKVDQVVFSERGGTAIAFEQLSAGYRSVMTWVVDLLSRLVEDQPEATSTEDFAGIVLVDEVGLHLHPKWEYNLVEKLRKWFPGLQFFFTTHSPMLLLGSSADAAIFKVYREDGETKVSGPVTDISHLMPNGLVTSPLFGLETMKPKSFSGELEDVSSEDFISRQVHAVIKKRMQENPGVIDEAEILSWVEEEMAKLEKGE